MKNFLLYFVHRLQFIVLFLVFLCYSASSQSILIKGNISASSTAVQNAKVIFTDGNTPSNIYTALTDSEGNYMVSIAITSVSNSTSIPVKFELEQNYPNPFSGSTAIPFKLQTQSDIHVTIYDILGRVVKRISAGDQSAGAHVIQWDGDNNLGQRVSAGIYFYRLEAGGESLVKKMIATSGRNAHFTISPSVYGQTSAGKISGVNISGNNFTVKIENLINTSPQISDSEFSNIEISSDTTLNFVVEKQSASVIKIYPDSLLQIIRGFGAANIMSWRPDMTDDNIEKAFGTGEGQIGFSILRLRVPSSTSEFSKQVATAKKASAKGITVFGSPWSPPASLKSNNNIVGGYLLEEHYADYAAHLKSFVDYMSSNGVTLYAISVQNEPDVTVSYESCDWYDYEMVKFIKENAPSIGTKIIAPESYHFDKTISNAILNDSAAAPNLDIVGGHLYGGGLEEYPLAKSMGKELWMTEYLELDTTWTANLGTGKQMNDCLNDGMNAYIWWYIVRFYGPIHEDGYVTKRGYVMSNFARFIRPGYYKIKSDYNPQKNVYSSAYIDSSTSKLVIIAINTSSSPVQQTFNIFNNTVTAFIPYVTSSVKNCRQENEVTISGSTLTYTIEASSITTFVGE